MIYQSEIEDIHTKSDEKDMIYDDDHNIYDERDQIF